MLDLFRRTVTLDISSAAVRLLTVRGRRVDRWASAPLEPGLVENGVVMDTETLGVKVKQLMRASNIGGKKVVASLSGLYSISRVLPVTRADKQSVREAVLQAAEASMPMTTEQMYLSWQTISDGETGSLALVIGTPREIVDAEVQALRSVGITPHILNLKSMALMRLVDRRHALVVNIDSDSFDMALVVDGVPQVMRTVVQGPSTSMAEQVEGIGQALEQVSFFYESQHARNLNNLTLPLFLAGQGTDNPLLVAMVQSSMPYPLTPLAVPMEHPANLPVSQYAVNIGLALGQISVSQRMRADEVVLDEMEETSE